MISVMIWIRIFDNKNKAFKCINWVWHLKKSAKHQLPVKQMNENKSVIYFLSSTYIVSTFGAVNHF